MPVLSYDPDQPARPLWLARCICGLAMMNGLVSAGYVLPSRIPGSSFIHNWTDMPVVACGLLLAVFGGLGIFLLPGSRLGTAKKNANR